MKSPPFNADIASEKYNATEKGDRADNQIERTSTKQRDSHSNYLQKVDSKEPFYTKNVADEINVFTPVADQSRARETTAQSDFEERLMVLQDPERLFLEKENKRMKSEHAKLQSQVKFYKTKYQ